MMFLQTRPPARKNAPQPEQSRQAATALVVCVLFDNLWSSSKAYKSCKFHIFTYNLHTRASEAAMGYGKEIFGARLREPVSIID